MNMSNTAGKLLKRIYHNNDLDFDKMISIAKDQGVNDPVLDVVMAMSFEYGTSHFFGEESDKDS